MKVKIVDRDKVVDEEGHHVGTVLKKGFRKKEAYCFICDKTVPSLKHFEEEH